MKTKLFIAVIGLLFITSCKTTKKSVEHGWITNLEEGIEFAKKENKAVLALFTGSDWCPPCKKLHHDVMESKEFLDYAKDNLVLVLLDFPRRPQNKLEPTQAQYNNQLKRKYRISGFPSVLMLNGDGKETDRFVGYRPTDIQTTLNKYKEAVSKK